MAMRDVIIGYVKGPKGDKGDTGGKGDKGDMGATGQQGPLPPLVASYLATAAGQGALDAYMGKLIDQRLTDLMNKFTQLNGELEMKIAKTTFKAVLEGRSGKTTFIAFHMATDNPFAFNSGYCIAFNSLYLHVENQFILIGVSFSGDVVDCKSIEI